MMMSATAVLAISGLSLKKPRRGWGESKTRSGRCFESFRQPGVGFEQTHLLGQVPVRPAPERIFALTDPTGAVADGTAADRRFKEMRRLDNLPGHPFIESQRC